MKTSVKNPVQSRNESTTQSAIDENPLVKPSLNSKEAKRENKEKKKKKAEQKQSEWKI